MNKPANNGMTPQVVLILFSTLGLGQYILLGDCPATIYHIFNSKFVQTMGGSPGYLSEDPVTQEKRKKGWRMSCDVGEATEGWENGL